MRRKVFVPCSQVVKNFQSYEVSERVPKQSTLKYALRINRHETKRVF